MPTTSTPSEPSGGIAGDVAVALVLQQLEVDRERRRGGAREHRPALDALVLVHPVEQWLDVGERLLDRGVPGEVRQRKPVGEPEPDVVIALSLDCVGGGGEPFAQDLGGRAGRERLGDRREQLPRLPPRHVDLDRVCELERAGVGEGGERLELVLRLSHRCSSSPPWAATRSPPSAAPSSGRCACSRCR